MKTEEKSFAKESFRFDPNNPNNLRVQKCCARAEKNSWRVDIIREKLGEKWRTPRLQRRELVII